MEDVRATHPKYVLCVILIWLKNAKQQMKIKIH